MSHHPPDPPEQHDPPESGPTDVVELDLRGLEPPQPMVEILSALVRLPSGGLVVALIPRKPIYLLPRLEEAGHHYQVEQLEDELWELRITKG